MILVLLAILASIIVIGLLFLPGLIQVWFFFYDKTQQIVIRQLKLKKMEKTGIELIADERKRQIEEEGFDPVHDERWTGGEMAIAAICYAEPGKKHPDFKPYEFPWDSEWWKPTPDDRVRELVKAGALIAAEIDRLNNLETP